METITEDYVSFETAKLLKEKGFDKNLQYYYDTDGILVRCCNGEYFSNKKSNSFIAPTLQMAMKWLVQEYRFYVNVAPSVEGYYWTDKWHSYVEMLNKRYPFGKFVGTFNSPEQASEEAIKYCLKNLI